jgi:YfiH family protein
MILAPNLAKLDGIIHGFGLRDSEYPAGIVTVKQIHSSIVFDASAVDSSCQGDALVSHTPGRIVGIKTADCVPILLADPATRAVASVHAGWRGTAANIIQRTVSAMSAQWQTRPEDIRAAIGPSIGPCCYEVGEEVARHFGMHSLGMGGSGKVHLDLPRENEKQLRAAGVRDIWISGECTFCAAGRFFSWRREQERAGRMISFIGLT